MADVGTHVTYPLLFRIEHFPDLRLGMLDHQTGSVGNLMESPSLGSSLVQTSPVHHVDKTGVRQDLLATTEQVPVKLSDIMSITG